MTQLMQPFDASKVDPTQSGGQMPVGKHPVVIRDSELKATQDKTSGYLQLNLEIIDGPSKGTTGPYRLNLYNTNETAVRIAHQQLSAICHAIGQLQEFIDPAVLYNRPFIVEVGLQKDPDAAAKGYTEVKKVYDINGNEPGKAPAGGQPGPNPNQAGNGGGQWGAQQGAQQAPPAGGGGWGGGQSSAPPPGQGNAPAGNQPAWGGGQQGNQPAWGGGGQQGGQQNPPWGKK
jgi:hypothetical protein